MTEGEIAEAESSSGLLPRATLTVTEDRRFALLVDAATALREASQLALVANPGLVRDLLLRSGRLYLRASVPYGAYLVALSDYGSPSDAESFGRHLSNAVRTIRRTNTEEPGEPLDGADNIATAAAATPQQQVYLLLAGLASTDLEEQFLPVLSALMEGSPHRRSNLPVGALGIPTMRYWSAAKELMELGRSTHDEALPVPRTSAALRWLANRHADVVNSARVNDYLWHNLASPVDVIDLDLVGLAALAMRQLGMARVLDTVGSHQSELEFQHLQLAGNLT